MARLKVIQWATGNIGNRALRAVLEHPALDLVGLWVSNPDKIGRDAAELCGAGGVSGIAATNDADALIATPADCVLYMRQGTDIQELCRILASGKNVITTRGDFHFPDMMDPADRTAIEAACAAGNASIYSTGSSPGFITEAVPIALLSLSRRLDGLIIDEFADVSSRNSPDLLFNIMGFGGPMREFEQSRADHLKSDFASSLAQLAKGCGIAIDQWTAHGEFAPARIDTQIAAGMIKAGHIGAQRVTVAGWIEDSPVLQFRANWYVTRDLSGVDWDLGGGANGNVGQGGWRIQIAGDTPLDVSIAFPVAQADYAAFTPGLTAHRPVNAISAVCAASPGIRTTIDLPNILADFTPAS